MDIVRSKCPTKYGRVLEIRFKTNNISSLCKLPLMKLIKLDWKLSPSKSIIITALDIFRSFRSSSFMRFSTFSIERKRFSMKAVTRMVFIIVCKSNLPDCSRRRTRLSSRLIWNPTLGNHRMWRSTHPSEYVERCIGFSGFIDSVIGVAALNIIQIQNFSNSQVPNQFLRCHLDIPLISINPSKQIEWIWTVIWKF